MWSAFGSEPPRDTISPMLDEAPITIAIFL
jgi:hypothetical protein